MRKDKGLNGDLDRLPMLTWIMFLKFLDDMEQIREQEADARRASGSGRPSSRPTAGATGRAQRARHHRRRAARLRQPRRGGRAPTARAARACSPTCAVSRAANGGDRRDVIATVFKGIINRMINGYLLRDVINKVNGIHFTSSDEIHTLGHLYESMLKEMRDAAGDSGEFYTPRPVVRFMVEVTEPAPGRDRPRPGLRHRRLPGGGVPAPGKAVPDRRGPRRRCRRAASSAARPSRCPTCWRR